MGTCMRSKGRTGNGRCPGPGKCEAIEIGPDGHWRHKQSVTGGRRKRAGGKGAVAARSAVPQELLEEIGKAWVRRESGVGTRKRKTR